MHYVCRQLPPSFPTHTCQEKAYKTNSIDTFRAIPPFLSHDTKLKSNTGNTQLFPASMCWKRRRELSAHVVHLIQ